MPEQTSNAGVLVADTLTFVFFFFIMGNTLLSDGAQQWGLRGIDLSSSPTPSLKQKSVSPRNKGKVSIIQCQLLDLKTKSENSSDWSCWIKHD